MEGILPPLAVGALSRLFRWPGFYGNYSSFDAAAADSVGYSNASIAQAVAAMPRKNDIELHQQMQHVLAAFAPALIGRTHLSVLDVGGANGAHFHTLRPFLPQLDWTILETPEMVRACANGEIRYVEDITQLATSYDVVLLSGVLQYLRDPYAELTRFASLSEYTVVTRLPLHTSDRLTLQKTPRSVYTGSYPAWFLEEQRLLRTVSSLGRLQMRWRSAEDTVLLDGHRIALQGMLIRK